MRGIWRKLGSRRGASITFALLLFLVCSVLCVVVLAAGSTASGRMAGVSQADQRYYAVGSMAELLQNALVGKTVKVRYIKPEDADEDPSYEIVSDDATGEVKDLASKVALRLVKRIKEPKAELPPEWLDVSIEPDAGIGEILKCSIQERDRLDGWVIFDVSCPPIPKPETPGTSTGDWTKAYTLQVGFAATISESSEEKIETGEGGGTKTVITVTWNPNNVTIRKGAVNGSGGT